MRVPFEVEASRSGDLEHPSTRIWKHKHAKDNSMSTLAKIGSHLLLIFAAVTGSAMTSRAAEIPIGISMPLTGAFAASGTYVLNGARIAVEEINAEGGVLGSPLK